MAQVTVGVAGATGYLGQALLRLLAHHPNVTIGALASSSKAGEHVTTALPHFAPALADAPAFVPLDTAAFTDCDVAFFATPNGVASGLAPGLLAAGVKVIDLSGDHRLAAAEAAETHYGRVAPATADAVYGLPEVARADIAAAGLVANPGCYPTASALAALPLVAAELVAPHLIVDAKSGVSGAGREPTSELHYPEANESVRAYKVGTHRHQPEIAQTLTRAARAPVAVTFTPHIVPMDRGILATVYAFPAASGAALDQDEVDALFAKRYAAEPFVRVVKHEPDTKLVRGTNFCDIKPHVVSSGVVVTAAIDNLLKGGSGQAVQNMNLMFGLPETTGLPVLGGGP